MEKKQLIIISLLLFFTMASIFLAISHKKQVLEQQKITISNIHDTIIKLNNNDEQIRTLSGESYNLAKQNNNDVMLLTDRVNAIDETLNNIIIPQYDRVATCQMIITNETTFEAKCKR